MIRKSTFFIREGFKALKRSRIAGILTIMAFTVFSGLMSLTLVAQHSLDTTRNNFMELFELEAFIVPGRETFLDSMAETLRKRDGVKEVEIITREEAVNRFSNQYGDELFDLLEENPLPASIIVKYDPKIMNQELFQNEAKQISKYESIDDVVYEGELLVSFQEITDKIQTRALIADLVVLVSSLILTMVSVKVSVRYSKSWVKAVSLIGGKLQDIQMPFIISGALSGGLGGILGCGIIAALQLFLSPGTDLIPPPHWFNLGIISLITIILGTIFSAIAAPKRWEEIVAS